MRNRRLLWCLAAGVLLLLAQPGDTVQTHDLGRLPWKRFRALEGRVVRVRFTVDHVAGVTSPPEGGEVVLVVVVRPEGECRFVALPRRDEGVLTRGAQLEAEGVLRVSGEPVWLGDAGRVGVLLDNARLVR